jgi:hypothetical protein
MTAFNPLLRYRDLKARGVANSRAQLKRMVELYGFPPGRLLTPNTRVWTIDEIDGFLASRPTKPKPVKRGRPRKNNQAAAGAA